MPYYPSSFPSKANRSGNGPLRVLGALLSLTSMILAALGILFHQSTLGLMISVIVALFGLRVFMLWLGARVPPVTLASSPTASTRPPVYPTTSTFNQEQEPALHTRPLVPIGAGLSLPSRAGASPTIHGLRGSLASYKSYTQTTQTAPMAPAAPITAYPSQPAYAAQSSYAQAQQPPIFEERRPQAPTSRAPYIPPIFELDPPVGNVQCFILPKEGAPLVECQDRYALHAEHRCYAVADGVAGSFVPGPWARIIAKSFVERSGTFLNKDDFQAWLIECGQQWHKWQENRWLPTTQSMRKRGGDSHGDRSNGIHPGAQTTLIGCSLLSQRERQDAATAVSVFAIGDSEFFLFRPNTSAGWDLVEMFPYSDPDEFGFRPDTLVTALRTDLLERAWAQRKTKLCKVSPGDIIVLASHTLAKWLLTQVQQHTDRWRPLLSGITPAEFEQYIRTEFHNGRIEDDDLTMLIIPIQ